MDLKHAMGAYTELGLNTSRGSALHAMGLLLLFARADSPAVCMLSGPTAHGAFAMGIPAYTIKCVNPMIGTRMGRRP